MGTLDNNHLMAIITPTLTDRGMTMAQAKDIDIEAVKARFNYDPLTGLITRKITTNYNAKKGTIAGSINSKGYIVIKIASIAHKAHRLAWVLYYNEQPPEQIDHKDEDKTNNRVNNLRAATHGQNQMNTRPQVGCKSQYKGVTYSKRHDNYICRIATLGNREYLGTFGNEHDAARAYNKRSKEMHGEYARLNVIKDHH